MAPREKKIEENVKKVKVPENVTELVYTDSDKLRRATDAFLILTGKQPKEPQMSGEHRAYLKGRFTELLEEAGLSLEDKDAAIWFIYKKMGGGTRTHDQQARIKKQGNIFKSKAAKEAAPVDDNDEDTGDDEDEDEDDD